MEEMDGSIVDFHTSPETILWRAVIGQALTDALGKISDSDTNHELVCYRARVWIERQGGDFKMVCRLAGLEPSDVWQHATEYVTSAINKKML